jgi:hypothetical protein
MVLETGGRGGDLGFFLAGFHELGEEKSSEIWGILPACRKPRTDFFIYAKTDVLGGGKEKA